METRFHFSPYSRLHLEHGFLGLRMKIAQEWYDFSVAHNLKGGSWPSQRRERAAVRFESDVQSERRFLGLSMKQW